MTYEPTLLVTSGVSVDTLKAASDKINANFEAIADGINEAIDGRDWQDSCIDKDATAPPVSLTEGDRYIVASPATAAWLGHELDVAEYRDSAWLFVTPNEGYCCRLEDENLNYVYNGSAWVTEASNTNHNSLAGINGGASDDYQHLTTSELAKVTGATATPTASKIPIADGSAKLDGWITTPVLATARGAASGVASLNASTKVVEDPANATATPTASKIPIADGSAKLDGWITTPILATEKAAASGVASLDVSSKVVQDPANATATKTASKIPIADGSGYINTWIQTGSTTGTMCAGDDSRLSDNRAPTNHNLIDTTGHPVTGLTIGHVLKATGATAYGFGDSGIIISDATAKTAPVDGDYLALSDSETTPTAGLLKKLSWSYVKSVLKTYFDGIYTLSNLGGIPTTAKGAASGVASLNASTKVVEDPANATATPTASKIPIADGSGKLAAGWGGSASTLATLDSNSLVVQNPANATSTQAIAKIPISDADGTVDSWTSPEYVEINTDILEIEYIPVNYTRTLTPEVSETTQLSAHLKGIDEQLAVLAAAIAALE